MRHILVITLVLISVAIPSSMSATCWITPPMTVIECQYHPWSTCCITEETSLYETCFSAFCIDDDVCVIEELVGRFCLGRSDPPMSREALWDHFGH